MRLVFCLVLILLSSACAEDTYYQCRQNQSRELCAGKPGAPAPGTTIGAAIGQVG